jgi:uncharacterized protein (DUF342 family)
VVLLTNSTKMSQVEEGFKISFSNDELSAFIYIEEEKIQDRDITPEIILRNINAAGVSYGVENDLVEKIAAEKIFNEKLKIAGGVPAENGQSARFELCFDPERKAAPKEGPDGRIDYRDMDFLQNAEAGQVLVKKVPPTPGRPGKSVKNQPIPAKPGKDKNIPRGANTELSPDGLTLSAAKSGTIVYAGSVVSIQPVTTISGSIDLSTGNITCKGSLKVMKDVKSDFKVEVDGDLEIGGNVEDAEIICKGNVIVKGGFIGRSEGIIDAIGDVTLKYIINQKIQSDGNVTIGGEAVNARVHARDEIRMIGSRAKVVGGVMTARKLIHAATLGADAGTRTILKVAYDTELMEKARRLQDEINRLRDDEKRIKAALVELYRLSMDGKLPPQKQAALKKLEEFKKSLPIQLRELDQQQKQIDEKLSEFHNAAVIAEKKVFPGVQVHIGRKYKEVDNICGPTIFELHSDSIVASRFDRDSHEAREKARRQKERKALEAMQGG